MGVNTLGRVMDRAGTFNSGWFLMNKFTVSATTDIVANWKDRGDDVSSVRIEFRNLQTATIWGPAGLITVSTDSGVSFIAGANYLFQYGHVRAAAATELWTHSIGLTAAIQFTGGTSTTSNIAGATGGTSFPAGWDMTIEVLKPQGGGSGVPIRFDMSWPATTTLGLHAIRGTGMLMQNTPINALKLAGSGLTLAGGNVEIWGMQSKNVGFP
jgi:hypothetical protein